MPHCQCIPQFGVFFFSFFFSFTNQLLQNLIYTAEVGTTTTTTTTDDSKPFCCRYFQVTPTPTNDVPKRGQTSTMIRWVRLDSREG